MIMDVNNRGGSVGRALAAGDEGAGPFPPWAFAVGGGRGRRGRVRELAECSRLPRAHS